MATGDTELRTLIQNEQTKIRATLFNTVAAGLVVAGVVTPLASAGLTGMPVTGPVLALMAVWFLGASILHFGAVLTLESLKP